MTSLTDPIRRQTEQIELGLAGFVASLLTGRSWEVVREPHPVRSGASFVVRNHVGVEFIVEVEALWEPDR